MDNKVNFLRGTSAEYESSIKDNDTFYYTTDDEKLYLGNKEITGGGVTIDDTLSDTSKNPVQNKVITNALNTKANLTDIPTTLPADGGNADTVNGLTVQTAVPANAVFTDTKVTAVGNHYTPSGGSTTSASGGTLTDITNSSAGVQVVTGITKDAAGHVTGITSAALTSSSFSGSYGDLTNRPTLTGENLLVNSYLRRPINQRGKYGTITEAGYFIDHWKLISGSVQVGASGIILDGVIEQTVETPPIGNVVASANAGIATYDASTNVFTLTASGDLITWAKLEAGTVATGYIAPDPAVELAKCQRYYQRISGYTHFGSGHFINETTAQIVVPIAPMRISPDINLVGTAYINCANHSASKGVQSTSISGGSYEINNNSIYLPFITSSTSDVVGYGCTVQFRDASHYLELNAELD